MPKSSVPPEHPAPSCAEETGTGQESESKGSDWPKHILKYNNYYHSHSKSAEKVTWQITQIGNSAGCLSWQWAIRSKEMRGKGFLHELLLDVALLACSMWSYRGENN